MKTITLLPGDGIGPEVTAATLRVIEAAGARYEWESHLAGSEALARYGNPLPQDVLDSILQERRGAQGSGDDAGRHRLRLDQCPAAQGARPLRQPAAVAERCPACRAGTRAST